MEELHIVVPAMDKEFTQTELDIIAEHFTNQTVKKYLQHLLLTNITEAANIPLPQLATEPQVYVVKQAFMKGAIGCLNDLLSIEKAPKAQQPPLQQVAPSSR